MPDISKITMPNGIEYNIKDSVAREIAKHGGSNKKIIELTKDENGNRSLPVNLEIMDFVGAIIHFPNLGYYSIIHVYDKLDSNGNIVISMIDFSAGAAYVYTYQYRPETGALVEPM